MTWNISNFGFWNYFFLNRNVVLASTTQLFWAYVNQTQWSLSIPTGRVSDSLILVWTSFLAKINLESYKRESIFLLVIQRYAQYLAENHSAFTPSELYQVTLLQALEKSLPIRLFLQHSGIAHSFYPLPRLGVSCSQERDTSVSCCLGASKRQGSELLRSEDKHQHSSQWSERSPMLPTAAKGSNIENVAKEQNKWTHGERDVMPVWQSEQPTTFSF